MSTLGSKDEETQVLTRLGLTITQAKAFLALCRTGTSQPKTIAKESKIARQDIYRILAELQRLGLVERAITAPIMFKTIPLQDAILLLLERRVKETSELHKETRRLLKSFREGNKRNAFTVEEAQFVLIPKGRAYITKGKKSIEAAQASIECVTSWKRFLQVMLVAGEDYMEALNRGVKFRVITDRPKNQKHLPKIVEGFYRNPSFNIRHILTSPRALIMCFDKKEVLIAASADEAFPESTMLWSNAPPLVSITRDYFEIIWITAIEDSLRI
jgi:sugar-specific transcriptional regulator TrmB